MAHEKRTLLLNDKWDAHITESGKIAVSEAPAYSTAQDVANECRRFFEDSYFDYNIGIPHFGIELGKTGNAMSTAMLRAALRKAALRVADVLKVLSVEIDVINRETRTLTGSIKFSTVSGQILTVKI